MLLLQNVSIWQMTDFFVTNQRHATKLSTASPQTIWSQPPNRLSFFSPRVTPNWTARLGGHPSTRRSRRQSQAPLVLAEAQRQHQRLQHGKSQQAQREKVLPCAGHWPERHLEGPFSGRHPPAIAGPSAGQPDPNLKLVLLHLSASTWSILCTYKSSVACQNISSSFSWENGGLVEMGMFFSVGSLARQNLWNSQKFLIVLCYCTVEKWIIHYSFGYLQAKISPGNH